MFPIYLKVEKTGFLIISRPDKHFSAATVRREKKDG